MDNALRTIVTLAAAAVIFTGCKKKEEVEVVEPEQPPVKDFPVLDVDTFDYVAVEMEGSYDQHGKAIAQLQQAMQEQGIEAEGPMFGIYYNSPADVPPELLEWEVGFPVTLAEEPQPPLVAKRWDYLEVVSTVYEGPYQSAEGTYEEMFRFIDSREDIDPAGPTLERFLDENPDMVEPDDLQTEIWIPVVEPEPEPEPETGQGDETEDDTGEEAAGEETEEPAGEADEPE
jgi:effector-binding domain-containing protein